MKPSLIEELREIGAKPLNENKVHLLLEFVANKMVQGAEKENENPSEAEYWKGEAKASYDILRFIKMLLVSAL